MMNIEDIKAMTPKQCDEMLERIEIKSSLSVESLVRSIQIEEMTDQFNALLTDIGAGSGN